MNDQKDIEGLRDDIEDWDNTVEDWEKIFRHLEELSTVYRKRTVMEREIQKELRFYEGGIRYIKRKIINVKKQIKRKEHSDQ